MFPSVTFMIMLLPFATLAVEDKPNKYTRYNYCKLNCDVYAHSACMCIRIPPRKEIRNLPYKKFRKMVLHEHNKWRNYLASGNESRPQIGWTPAAGNMLVMSYDLELEYITRCRGLMTFRYNEWDETGQDKCRLRKGGFPVGQNLFGSSENDTLEMIRSGIQTWYDEVEWVTDEDIVDQFGGIGDTIGSYTQMIWWSTNRVGCSMVYNPENRESWRYTLICNYASSVVPTSAGNRIGAQIYQRSETPCDSCPNGTTCGATPEYPYLCGKQKPVPTQAPALIKRTFSEGGESFGRSFEIGKPPEEAFSRAEKKGDKVVGYFLLVLLYLVY